MTKADLENYRNEVESELHKLGGRPKLIGELWRVGLRVPVTRKRLKEGYSFSGLRDVEVLKIWDYIWKNSDIYEAMSQSLYAFQGKSEITKPEFNKIVTWIGRITCWEHSDDLSKIYAQIVEENANWIMPHIEKWNRSKNSWKRRQSIVGLLEYSSKRKKVPAFETLIGFVIPLLGDDEYYVQKGVGWTLREIYNVYPKETLKFIERNLGQISPKAYSAATEKLTKKVKERINKKRKEVLKRV